jgi:hypothetical protein
MRVTPSTEQTREGSASRRPSSWSLGHGSSNTKKAGYRSTASKFRSRATDGRSSESPTKNWPIGWVSDVKLYGDGKRASGSPRKICFQESLQPSASNRQTYGA